MRKIHLTKDLCHQDTKARSFLIILLSLCLSAFIANLSGSTGSDTSKIIVIYWRFDFCCLEFHEIDRADNSRYNNKLVA